MQSIFAGCFHPLDALNFAVKGKRLRHQLLLDEWASLSTAGEYGLEVRLLTPIEMSSGAQFMSEPYRTRFEVMPRDEAHLEAACERFVQQIESTDNVEEMQGAAAALAHVDGPIVVPYLEQALGRASTSSIKPSRDWRESATRMPCGS